jgi:hypothetical protein
MKDKIQIGSFVVITLLTGSVIGFFFIEGLKILGVNFFTVKGVVGCYFFSILISGIISFRLIFGKL